MTIFFEVVEWLIALAIFLAGSYFIIESSKMIDEKKMRHRKGLTDYYDNEIK